jgi:hypothetical protein
LKNIEREIFRKPDELLWISLGHSLEYNLFGRLKRNIINIGIQLNTHFIYMALKENPKYDHKS